MGERARHDETVDGAHGGVQHDVRLGGEHRGAELLAVAPGFEHHGALVTEDHEGAAATLAAELLAVDEEVVHAVRVARVVALVVGAALLDHEDAALAVVQGRGVLGDVGEPLPIKGDALAPLHVALVADDGLEVPEALGDAVEVALVRAAWLGLGLG